jgi:16S rRNA (cytidine1402-2'-O)-methyltransferase
MPGILYVVATPIGNLEDITLRALRVLREVAVIAAEDTRRTARLLQHYSISTPTTSLHEHNERARIPAIIGRLQADESVAIVSDAGTPLISDPGSLLVATAHAAGIRVEPVPGPSAAMAAVSAAGIPAAQILFLGFPPSRSNARRAWLAGLAHEERLLVFYEAPHRIKGTLADLREIFGDRQAALGRELTKVHEELVVQPISAHLSAMGEPRGEYTVVVAPADTVSPDVRLPDQASLAEEFGCLTNTEGGSRRDAVRLLAEKYRVAPRKMYRLLEEARRDSV